jgi:hypothetical protein
LPYKTVLARSPKISSANILSFLVEADKCFSNFEKLVGAILE